MGQNLIFGHFALSASIFMPCVLCEPHTFITLNKIHDSLIFFIIQFTFKFPQETQFAFRVLSHI